MRSEKYSQQVGAFHVMGFIFVIPNAVAIKTIAIKTKRGKNRG